MLLLRDNQEKTFDRSAGRKGPSSGPRRGVGACLTPASPSPPACWSGNLMPDPEAFFKKFPPFSFTGFEGYFPNYPTGTPGFLLCSSALAFSVSVSTKSLAALSEQEQQGSSRGPWRIGGATGFLWDGPSPSLWLSWPPKLEKEHLSHQGTWSGGLLTG